MLANVLRLRCMKETDRENNEIPLHWRKQLERSCPHIIPVQTITVHMSLK